jgi:hypothetical protein
MSKALVFVLCLFLIISGGCAKQDVTTPPYTPPANVLSLPVTLLPTMDDDAGDIVVNNLTVTKGTLEEDYHTPWAGDHKAGEPCFLIRGHIENTANNEYYVAFFADGWDAAGNRVAGTLDAGPLVGIAQTSIESHSYDNFTLHLAWADNVTSFTLHTQKSPQMFP